MVVYSHLRLPYLMSMWPYTMDARGWNVEHVHDWILVSLNIIVLRLHVFLSKRLGECWEKEEEPHLFSIKGTQHSLL
jgi:hypothetical protein